MDTIGKGVCALTAAALAPVTVLMVPAAADVVMRDATDMKAWLSFGEWSLLAAMVSGLYVLLFGLPAFLLLHWRRMIRWWSAVASGFLLTCWPAALGFWPSDSELQTTASHWNGQRMVYTMIDGVVTFDGWIRYAEMVAAYGSIGALGGFAGWLVWRLLPSSAEQGSRREPE